MLQAFNRMLDKLSEYLAARKGLLPMLGVLLVVLNFVLQFFPDIGWVVRSNLLLHVGIIISVLGILLAWAL